MKEYGTPEQYKEICESAYNGNWTQAFKECAKYGFFANDLIQAFETEKDEMGGNLLEATDLALLAEGAYNYR